MRVWLTAHANQRRYGWFTLHRVESRHGQRTYCGSATASKARFRTPGEMLDDNEFNPCGRCWSGIAWDEVKAEMVSDREALDRETDRMMDKGQ